MILQIFTVWNLRQIWNHYENEHKLPSNGQFVVLRVPSHVVENKIELQTDLKKIYIKLVTYCLKKYLM